MGDRQLTLMEAIAQAQAEGRILRDTTVGAVVGTNGAAASIFGRLSEDEFNAAVVDLAESLGWRVAHFRPAQTKKGAWVTAMRGKKAKGYPDLTMVRGSRLVFAELKRKPNTPSAEQLNWLDDLRAAGAEAYLWWTTDWNEIVRCLEARERPT